MKDKFNDVDKLFDRLGAKNKERLEHAKIAPIHEDFQFSKNGSWILIGTMGSGKTYNYLKLAAKQEKIYDEPFYEDIVICSTSGEFDETVRTFKKSIRKSNLITVQDNDLLQFLNDYIAKSKTYNTLVRFVRSNFRDPDDEMIRIINDNNLNNRNRLIEFIANKMIQIGWETYPHRMLLILDDFASHPLLKHKEFPLPALLKKLRHFHITVIICVQTSMSIPPDIKRIASDYILYPGLSHKDFKNLIKDSTLSCFDPEELWFEYSKMKDVNSHMKIHTKTRKYFFD